MKNWEEDDVITDYISNPVLNLIAELGSGNVTEAVSYTHLDVYKRQDVYSKETQRVCTAVGIQKILIGKTDRV